VSGKKDRPQRVSRDDVLSTLRDRIIDGYYPQGVKLVEQDLAQEFGMSRPLLREVLGELESHGLVEKLRNKGTMVRRISSRSLLEIMEIREVLEGLAARLAAQNSKPGDWRDLENQFGEPFEQIVKNLDFEKYLDLISLFRDRMVVAAQSEELSKLINSQYAKIRVVQRRIVILPGRMQHAIKEHRDVLKAILAGDADKAENMKRINMKNARECLEKYKKWVL
jgi:DNA-binding GntR family transcriptional regulator